MPVLSVAQTIALARKHGFTEAELPDFCAVCSTESDYNTSAVQKNGLGRGLVQIDLGQHPSVTEAQALDPDFAAAFARKLSRNKNGLGASNWYGPRDHPAKAERARQAAREYLASEGNPPTMKFVPRSEWGARAPRSTTGLNAKQVTIHWAGTPSGNPVHDQCDNVVRSFQAYHMDGHGWADIAYNLIVCAHGYVYEGRGRNTKSAANGDSNSNSASYAICYLLGKGEPFTEAAKAAINEAALYLVPSGPSWTFHRRWTGSECPGDTIIAWVKAGHPGTPKPAPPAVPAPEEDEVRIVNVAERGIFLVKDKGSQQITHPDHIAELTKKAHVPYDDKVEVSAAVFEQYLQ